VAEGGEGPSAALCEPGTAGEDSTGALVAASHCQPEPAPENLPCTQKQRPLRKGAGAAGMFAARCAIRAGPMVVARAAS